jgi:multidrug resistance efflux pump
LGKSAWLAGNLPSAIPNLKSYMSEAAEVRSVPALHEFREAFATFGEDVREALSAAEMEIRRTLNHLEEQLKHWQAMVVKCERDVATAKIELNRKKIERVIGGRKPDITEQEENLRKAKARLQFAEEKVAKCRRWLANLPRAILEYEGPGRHLAGIIDAEVPKMLALLDRKLTALEAYLRIEPPSAAPAPILESSANAVSMAAPGEPPTGSVPSPIVPHNEEEEEE